MTNKIEWMDLKAWIDSLLGRLPENEKGDPGLRRSVEQHILLRLFGIIQGNMRFEDVAPLADKMVGDPERIAEILAEYIASNPHLHEMVAKELNHFESVINNYLPQK